MEHEFTFMDKLFIKAPPKTIMDLGANVGYSAAYFASRYPDAKIVALEPSFGNFATASINVHWSSNITLVWGGIWESQQLLKIAPVNRGEWCASLASAMNDGIDHVC